MFAILISALWLVTLLLWVFRKGLTTWKFHRAIRHFHGKRGVEVKTLQPDRHLFILLPVYLETDTVLETIKFLSPIVTRLKGKVSAYFVTTEKEKTQPVSITTRDVLEESLIKQDHVMVVHCPYTCGVKADQLNYALEQISFHDDDWIGVYDVDSRPEDLTFEYVLSYRGPCQVLQQPSDYLLNFDRLTNPILKMMAIYQTQWSFGYEYVNYLKQQQRILKRSSSILAARETYLVGHGMFIKGRVLRFTGGFSYPTEDLQLGHRLAFWDIPIDVVPYKDSCQFALTISDLVRQTSIWFYAESKVSTDFEVARDQHPSTFSLPKNRIILLKKHLMNAAWALEGWLFVLLPILTLTVARTGNNLLLLACFQVLCGIDFLISARQMTQNFGITLRRWEWTSGFLISFLALALKSSGPTYYFSKAVLSRVLRKRFDVMQGRTRKQPLQDL